MGSSRQVHTDSEDLGNALWLDGDNSIVEDDIDFITCTGDTFITDEDVNLTISNFLNLLLEKPIEVSYGKTTLSGQSPVILTKPVDCSFAFPL